MKPAIQKYYKTLENLQKIGAFNESNLRTAMSSLIEEYAGYYSLTLNPERRLTNNLRPDGTIVNSWNLPLGYWEAKDRKDKLKIELNKKIELGYPTSNLFIENGEKGILVQNGSIIGEYNLRKGVELEEVLKKWLGVKPDDVRAFEEALNIFNQQVPILVEQLRVLITEASEHNELYRNNEKIFLALCRNSINPNIQEKDVREMIIQHILTEDIFNKVFHENQFHYFNTIAREVGNLVETFFPREAKRDALKSIESYYMQIGAYAARIPDHTEKQKFLKLLYESFYRAYNPKASDKLGVVYTPNEIVDFMIRSTDLLVYKHFDKLLIEEGINILDPATGTGTFVCDLINFWPTGSETEQSRLKDKYKNEIYCNEVSILPYYIANLNIEHTYMQKTNSYSAFENISFVDTLDNVEALKVVNSGKGKSFGTMLNFGLVEENAKRIKKQNEKPIYVIIGNPPYYAKQSNYNLDNANRVYDVIDDRIKNTFVKRSQAQNKIVLYDMFVRFFKWAMDRIGDEGIIAFVTNRTFIDSLAFDGFRREFEDFFDYGYILDTQSDVRKNPKISGTQHNVFGIQTGVAISFWVKTKGKAQNERCMIWYDSLPDEMKRTEKLAWLASSNILQTELKRIPYNNGKPWVIAKESDWESLLPLVSKEGRQGKGGETLFQMFTSGLKTQRDEWVYDESAEVLKRKVKQFIEVYERTRKQKDYPDKMNIKWDRELDKYLGRNIALKFQKEHIIKGVYRPFNRKYFYYDKYLNGMTYQWPNIYKNQPNLFIAFNAPGNSRVFHALGSDTVVDLHATGDSQCIPLYRYAKDGQAVSNVTDWGLNLFRERYGRRGVEPETVFAYVYAVFHYPLYRSHYAVNLQRELPRIPLWDNFAQWAAWGQALLDLHTEYETAEPYALLRQDGEWTKDRSPKPLLRRHKTDPTCIELDEQTTLSGVPPRAWDYKLGNRSAIDWVLDQYKERTPKDPTIREQFNTYRFADYKEEVILLLQRVCTVSLATLDIVDQMPAQMPEHRMPSA